MTRKHYEAIAAEVRRVIVAGDGAYDDAYYAIKRLAVGMADAFAIDNPRFNYERFLTACGL